MQKTEQLKDYLEYLIEQINDPDMLAYLIVKAEQVVKAQK